MPEFIPKSYGKEKDCKIILLGQKNLERLRAYKAEVTKNLSVLPDKYPTHHASVTITVTGLSNKSANQLYEELESLPEEEITEVLKKKTFSFLEEKKK